MQIFDTMAKGSLPCVSYTSFKMFKISASEFCTMNIRRHMQACVDEFLAMVTEGVVHAVYKVVTRSSFGVTGRHKASGDKWTFHHCVTRWHTSYLGH